MKLSAVAAALMLSLPLTAFGDVTSTAQVGNFHFEVIDLDLNDGVAAALTLGDTGKLLTAGYYGDAAAPDPLHYLTEDGTVSATVDAGSSTASLANGVGNVSATFTGPTGELFSTVVIGHSFTLTANTRVILYADGSATGGPGPNEAWAPSHVMLFATTYDPVTGDPSQVEDILDSHLGNTEERELSVTIASGSDALEGELGIGAGAYAGITPVPEPSQVALLTVGLAGLGWRLRRARRS